MKSIEVELLRKQIAKLEAPEFDLKAWKTGTIVLLERIFGPANQKLVQIDRIVYDQSSWALREAMGSKNLMDTCKKQGREVLLIAIEELETLGLPEELEAARSEPLKALLTQALEAELKISQYREIVGIINSEKPIDERKKAIIDRLHEYGASLTDDILATVLTSEQVKGLL
ncbi:MAG: hypothetical protein U5K79_12045 [Cyclobacteriaceae bacterium]|nr:hypothetical protein [Cyclobacteriaceae bacterium]